VDFEQKEIEQIRKEFKISSRVPVLVAGSTHEGEEEELVRIYIRLLKKWSDLVLILVPRQPGRCGSVGEMILSYGVRYFLRTEAASFEKPLGGGDILLVDTMGEMLKVYSVADIVFVGGSLVPIGGHNVLEGSMVKKPVIFGPYMGNFKEISRLLQKAEGGICVQDGEGLYQCLDDLLHAPEKRKIIGCNGFALLEKNKGATDKTLNIIKKYLRP
jgi:3-deoxy-D-manno-octulosonic-acid transferase